MLPFPIDLLGIAGCYCILLLQYRALAVTKTHAMSARIFSALISYVFLFFAVDYVVNNLLIMIDVLISPFGLLMFFYLTVFNGALYWLVNRFSDKLELVEHINFVRASLVFGNYFRLRDVDTQEQIGTHRMKELYKEVHGTPFTDDVIATPFDQQPTRFKKVSIDELNKKERSAPPEYPDHVASLKERKRTDVSASFRFMLMDAGFHPFLKLMEQFAIDPQTGTLSFDIIAPLERPVPCSTPVEQTRLIERTYEALHLLIAQEWFLLYTPYVIDIAVRCCNRLFTEEMHESVVPLMEMRVPLNTLCERADRITTITEIRTIAEIQFFNSKEDVV